MIIGEFSMLRKHEMIHMYNLNHTNNMGSYSIFIILMVHLIYIETFFLWLVESRTSWAHTCIIGGRVIQLLPL
jgi:hypothetical protein